MTFRFNSNTQEEIEYYYSKVFPKKIVFIPEYILKSFKLKEFGFSLNGGIFKRYLKLPNLRSLVSFCKQNSPTSVYYSAATYTNPSERYGFIGSELVFDIDAKNYQKRCKCKEGKVCLDCLNNSWKAALTLKDVLKEDFGFGKVRNVISGRGFHIKCCDKNVVREGKQIREKIVGYITSKTSVKFDARVTIDVGRLIRLPTSLNTKSSIICTEIKNNNLDLERYYYDYEKQ